MKLKPQKMFDPLKIINNTTNMILLILFTIFQLTEHIQISNIDIQNSTISISTSYTFLLQRNDTALNIPTGSYLLMHFPSQYINRITYTNGTNISCSSVELASSGMYCTFVGNVIKVYNGFQTVGSIKRFYLTINNILNPFPAKAYDPFTVSINYTNDTIFQQGILPAQITTTTAKSACSITSYTNNFASSRGNILISYQSQYIQTTNTSSSYKLLISMNNSYFNDPLSTPISPQISGYSAIGVSGSVKFTINYTSIINISIIFPPSTMSVNNMIYMQAFVDSVGSVDWCYVNLNDIVANPMSVSVVSDTAIVQQLATYTFTLQPTTAIFSTDTLLIQFPSTYNNLSSSLSSTSATFFMGIFATKSITFISSQIVNISNLISTYITSKTIKFNLTNIKNPFFSSNTVTIKLTIMTNDGYLRTTGSYNLQITPGVMTINTFTCTTYQIGYKSSCKLNFTTSNSINVNSSICLTFATPNWMTSYSGTNTICTVLSSSLPQLKSIFQCRYNDISKSFVFTQFTNDLTNVTTISPFTAMVYIQQSSIDVDHRILLPWDVGTYQLSLTSYSANNSNEIIDTGIFSITTTKREIFFQQNNTLLFSSLTTMTISDILITYTLPFINGGSYFMRIYLPLQLSSLTSDIRTSYGTIVSYDILSSMLVIRMNDITLITNHITISGFKTYHSTKPITYTIQILYQSTVYYYYSTVIAITQPKTFSTFTITQSSSIVNQLNNLSLTITELQNNDILTYTTTDYTGYHLTNSTLCSPIGVINCNADNSISIITANNADQILRLTKFNFIIKNSPFVGLSTFIVTVYDDTKLYIKQNSTFFINVQQMNSINNSTITYTSSNPYFNQPTTLTISFSLPTPGATSLTITFPTTYTLSTSKCIKNCQLPIINLSNNMFIAQLLTGQDVSVEFQVINPMDFAELISFVTKDNMDRNVDYGQVKLTAQCQSPCRSCNVATDSSSCTSCYNFSIYRTLSGTQCLNSCIDGQYQVTQSFMFYCLACPSSCSKCTSNTTCQQCKPTYIYFNYTCLSNCPSGYFLSTDIVTGLQQCIGCSSPCKQCSVFATNCTQCVQSSYLFQTNCLANCPSGYYKTSTSICSLCPANCSQCQDTTGYCILCISNFYLYQNNCYAQCPIAGYSKNITSGKCQLCTTTCSICGQFVTQCQYCQSGYYMMNGVCQTNCPDTYFSNIGTRICQLCQDPCIKCTGSQGYCESCIAGRYFYSHQCYTQCPDGTYQITNSTVPSCMACSWPCLKCSDSLTCSQCSPPYALNVSQCIFNCGDGNFINSANQCQSCDSKCKTCNISGCIECSNPTDFLSTQSCVQSCSPLYKNQLTMRCQQCQSPCATCSTNSTTCSQCLSPYFLLSTESKCYLTCPPLYFSQSSYCKSCQQRNVNCKQCSIDNVTKSFSCSTCQSGAYFYGSICIDKCPNQTTVSNNMCVSSNCTQVQNCQLCSDLKCISCKSLYTLQNNTCSFRVVSAISNLKAPFPFLILVLCTILSSIAIKIYFPKMYIPLYLYSCCGIFQVACMVLWTGLGIITSRTNLQQQPINFYFATLLILMLYFSINILSFVLKLIILNNDKKFNNWQRQDNKSVSILVSLLSLAISFRFQLLIFSKLGNRQSFSAVVENKQKFIYIMLVNLASILLVSIPTICLACYLIYLQQQMNYLFFTCIQIATISLIMIVLSILAYLTPSEYILQKKDQYKKGYIEQNFIEGKSLTGLLCVEEEYYEQASVNTQQKNDGRKVYSQQEISSINQNDNQQFIDTKLSSQAMNINLDEQQQLADSIQHSTFITTLQYNSKKNDQKSTIKPQQPLLYHESRQQITHLLQKTLIRKQNILKQLIDKENDEIMREINDNFGIKQEHMDDQEDEKQVYVMRENKKKAGRIVRQLHDRYETYGQEVDSDIGSQISSLQSQGDEDLQEEKESSQNQNQNQEQQQMTSSKLLNGKNTKREQKQSNAIHNKNKKLLKNKQSILNIHQTLSLTEENNYIKQTIKKQTIQQNLINLQKIKVLLEQFAKQQKQQHQLNIKLFKLNNDLNSQQYIKLRQKIQNDNMTLQDKLSRLNQMYYQKKYQRDNQKRKNVITNNAVYQLDKDEIQNNVKLNFNYQAEEKNVQQIQPKKIKVQSIKKKVIKNAQNIELKTKNQAKPNAVKKQKNIQKKKEQIKLNIDKRKLYSASLTNRVKKSNALEPINEQDKKSSQTFLYIPMSSQRANNQPIAKQLQIIKLYPILPQSRKQQKSILNDDQQIQLLEEQHKSNTQWIESQIFVPKTTPLMFAQPLKQDEPQQLYDLHQQNEMIDQGDDNDNDDDNDNVENDIQVQKAQQNNKPIQKEKQKPKRIVKIQYHQGPIETINEDFEHWPIDPQLQQRITQVEKLAKSYLKSKKNPKNKLGKYASATLYPYHITNQKPFQMSGSQSKFTEANYNQEVNDTQKDNSIFNAARESQIDVNYPQGQMLIFQDDQDIIDQILETEEKSFQRNGNYNYLKETKVIELNLQSKKKIPKKRANRSVINLSPGKY